MYSGHGTELGKCRGQQKWRTTRVCRCMHSFRAAGADRELVVRTRYVTLRSSGVDRRSPGCSRQCCRQKVSSIQRLRLFDARAQTRCPPAITHGTMRCARLRSHWAIPTVSGPVLPHDTAVPGVGFPRSSPPPLPRRGCDSQALLGSLPEENVAVDGFSVNAA